MTQCMLACISMFLRTLNPPTSDIQLYYQSYTPILLNNITLSAVTLLPSGEQEHIRYQTALNLQKLYRQHNGKHMGINKTVMHENKTINQIKKNPEI